MKTFEKFSKSFFLKEKKFCFFTFYLILDATSLFELQMSLEMEYGATGAIIEMSSGSDPKLIQNLLYKIIWQLFLIIFWATYFFEKTFPPFLITFFDKTDETRIKSNNWDHSSMMSCKIPWPPQPPRPPTHPVTL